MSNLSRLELFMEHLKDNDKSPNTIASYMGDLKQYFSFNPKKVEQINDKDIRSYKDYLSSKELSIKSINRKLVSIKQFIDFVNESSNSALVIKIKLEKQQRQDYLEDMITKDDFMKMVQAADTFRDARAKAIFYTLLYTGVRVSEMLQINVKDIDREYITVKGKGAKHRDIFVPSRVCAIWQEYSLVRLKTSDKLFTGQRGVINRQTAHNTIKKYADLAGVNLNRAHAHNFRHLYCKMLIEKGYSIDTVADLAGHSDINTTRIYTRKTRSELVAAINEL